MLSALIKKISFQIFAFFIILKKEKNQDQLKLFLVYFKTVHLDQYKVFLLPT